MNFLGKIFVVIVLVLSVVFMSFAVMVYTTHRNWREEIEKPQTGLKARLTAATAEIDRLKTEHDRKVEELMADKLAADQQASTLAAERARLQQEGVQLQKDN